MENSETRTGAQIGAVCAFGDSLHRSLLAQEIREEINQAAGLIIKDFLDRGEPVVLLDDPHSVADEERLALIRAWYECRIHPEVAQISQGRFVVGIDVASESPVTVFLSADDCCTDSSLRLSVSQSDLARLKEALAKPKFPTVPTSNRAQRRRHARQRCKRWK